MDYEVCSHSDHHLSRMARDDRFYEIEKLAGRLMVGIKQIVPVNFEGLFRCAQFRVGGCFSPRNYADKTRKTVLLGRQNRDTFLFLALCLSGSGSGIQRSNENRQPKTGDDSWKIY